MRSGLRFGRRSACLVALGVVFTTGACKDDGDGGHSAPDSDWPCEAPSGFWVDEDGDGYGAGERITACDQPSGTTNNDRDCDDGDPTINPDGADVPRDGVDSDCAGGDACAVVTPYTEGDLLFTDKPSADMGAFCADYSATEGSITVTASNLPNLFGLLCLCGVEGGLEISSNEDLLTLDGLDLLSALGGDLVIRANPALTSLDDPIWLPEVGGDLIIEGNPTLSEITALMGLEAVGGDLVIRDNPALPAVAAQALVEAIGEEDIGGEVVIE